MTTDSGNSLVDGLVRELDEHRRELRRVRQGIREAFAQQDASLTREIDAIEAALASMQGEGPVSPSEAPKRAPRGSRRAALSDVAQGAGPVTASELIDTLTERDPQLSRGSARALLRSAEQAGELRRTGDKPLTYEWVGS